MSTEDFIALEQVVVAKGMETNHNNAAVAAAESHMAGANSGMSLCCDYQLECVQLLLDCLAAYVPAGRDLQTRRRKVAQPCKRLGFRSTCQELNSCCRCSDSDWERKRSHQRQPSKLRVQESVSQFSCKQRSSIRKRVYSSHQYPYYAVWIDVAGNSR